MISRRGKGGLFDALRRRGAGAAARAARLREVAWDERARETFLRVAAIAPVFDDEDAFPSG